MLLSARLELLTKAQRQAVRTDHMQARDVLNMLIRVLARIEHVARVVNEPVQRDINRLA